MPSSLTSAPAQAGHHRRLPRDPRVEASSKSCPTTRTAASTSSPEEEYVGVSHRSGSISSSTTGAVGSGRRGARAPRRGSPRPAARPSRGSQCTSTPSGHCRVGVRRQRPAPRGTPHRRAVGGRPRGSPRIGRHGGLVAHEQQPRRRTGGELDAAERHPAPRRHRDHPVAHLGVRTPVAAGAGRVAVPVHDEVDDQPGVHAARRGVPDRVGAHRARARPRGCPARSRTRTRRHALERRQAVRPRWGRSSLIRWS